MYSACELLRNKRYINKLFYKITKIVRALWLAERPVCMRVCKHGCDANLFGFPRANHASTNLKKGFELKNSISWLYLPISSSVETWKIFRNMLCQFFFAWADILSEKNPYFGKHLFCKTNTDYAYNNCLNFRVRGKFEVKILIVVGHSDINTTYFK